MTKEQREALQQLQVNKSSDLEGFHGGVKVEKDISIIEEFKSNPSKVAVFKELQNATN